MSVAPPTAAAGAATGREMSDAERAHCDMVNLRVDIAQRIQVQRRVQRQRRAREAATPQVAETTGTPMFRRVRGARQIAREDVVDDVDAKPEVMSKAPSTPAAAEAVAQNETPAEQDAHLEATREVKRIWQRLFALAETWPAQAVTSRLGAVSTLHERAHLAFVEAARADERVGAARAEVLSRADERETEGGEKTPNALVTAAAAAGADTRSPVVETTCPGSTSGRNVTSPDKHRLIEDVARLESFARSARETAFDLNGALACLMEAVDCEARAELRMAWEAVPFGGGGGGAALSPAHHLPNQWPLGSAIAFSGAFTGGLIGGNHTAPTFAPAVPVAPLVAPAAGDCFPYAPTRAPATRRPMPPPKEGPFSNARAERPRSNLEPREPREPGEPRERREPREPREPRWRDPPKKRPRPNAKAEGVAESAPRRASARRVRSQLPGAATCRATTRTGTQCTFRAVYGAFCARHGAVLPTPPKQKDVSPAPATGAEADEAPIRSRERAEKEPTPRTRTNDG